MPTYGSGGGRLVALIGLAAVAGACPASPYDAFNGFVDRARAAADANAAGGPGDAVLDLGPVDLVGPGDAVAVDLTGAFLLVFTTELKPEPSRDVRLDLVQGGDPAAGTAVLSGQAVAAEDPATVLGTIPAAAVGADGRFQLRIVDFTIPPGQEPLLPNGGTAEFVLDAQLRDADRFCGTLDFHLLTPIDLHQPGPFAAWRVGAAEPGGAECPP